MRPLLAENKYEAIEDEAAEALVFLCAANLRPQEMPEMRAKVRTSICIVGSLCMRGERNT